MRGVLPIPPRHRILRHSVDPQGNRQDRMLPKRDWLEMTWQDLAGADTARWIAVLPVAAVEQHGPHLPLGVDTFIAEAYLARVRAALPPDMPVTFLPVQQLGQSDEHLSFPGTLTLSSAVVIKAWSQIGESL